MRKRRRFDRVNVGQTRVGKSMSIVGKIPCNGGEDCVCDCWQNGKTLSWKMTFRLVKKVPASI